MLSNSTFLSNKYENKIFESGKNEIKTVEKIYIKPICYPS